MNTINLIKLTDALSVDELMAVVGGKEDEKEVHIHCKMPYRCIKTRK